METFELYLEIWICDPFSISVIDRHEETVLQPGGTGGYFRKKAYIWIFDKAPQLPAPQMLC